MLPAKKKWFIAFTAALASQHLPGEHGNPQRMFVAFGELEAWVAQLPWLELDADFYFSPHPTPRAQSAVSPSRVRLTLKNRIRGMAIAVWCV